jgi:hypothetical protein
MNIIDDIELSVLEETGDLITAETIGTALRYTFESLAAILGLPQNFWTEMVHF